MIKFILLGILAIFLVCAAIFAIWVFVEIKNAPEGPRSFTCYLLEKPCRNPELKCSDCPVFKERMQPEQEEPEPLEEDDPEEGPDGAEEAFRSQLQREVESMLQEPPLRTQEPHVRTQRPVLRIQEPPIEPEFIDMEERAEQDPEAWVTETGPLVCTGEEKPLPEAGPASRIERTPWTPAREMTICAFRNQPCRLLELGGDPCMACFYMHDGEMLLKNGAEDKAE